MSIRIGDDAAVYDISGCVKITSRYLFIYEVGEFLIIFYGLNLGGLTQGAISIFSFFLSNEQVLSLSSFLLLVW